MRADGPRRAAQVGGRPGGQDVAGRGGDDQRPDQVRAAALVLLRALLAVLVGADRDVLGSVIRGELAAAEREEGRGERQHPRGELAGDGAEPGRLSHEPERRRRSRASRRAPPGRSNGSRASGSLRRSSGIIANDSASRSGPRRNGVWTPGANRRLRADATLISPDGVRIAHAHAVGPCTSTPFESAIPPRRILLMPPA